MCQRPSNQPAIAFANQVFICCGRRTPALGSFVAVTVLKGFSPGAGPPLYLMSIRNYPGMFKPPRQDALQLSIGKAPIGPTRPPDGCNRTGDSPPPTRTLLDKAQDLFAVNPHETGPAMYELQSGLAAIRSTATAESWQGVVAQCLAHPVGQAVWQDPFTAHSFRKPRGYSGDAELLDYLYGLSEAPAGTSRVGASIFKHMVAQQGGLSVRSRGEILADLIDETADLFKSPRILSIACGHLREGLLSSALKEGRVGELVALDQDTRSLAEVDRVFAGTAVRTVNHSVRDLLGGEGPV